MNDTHMNVPIVNGVGASWFEDLSSSYLDECLDLGVNVIGCTANDTWDDTLESIENLQSVKQVVRDHGRGYVVQRRSDLVEGLQNGQIGVVLGFQNPKPMSDSLSLLEAFIDMGLRCCGLAFRDNSYYGCGFSSPIDSGLSQIGQGAVRLMNRRGVVIDLSHVGDQTALDAIALSEHPAIFTHSIARSLVAEGPKVEWNGLKNNTVRRAAPDPVIQAAVAKGGVICPDARMAGSIENFIKHIEYLVELVGIDHVGITAQDDWHRSEKDSRRIQPYLPGYDSVVGNKKRTFGADYRIYRMEDQLGQRVFQADALASALRATYGADNVAKIFGGNMYRVLCDVLPA